MKRGKIATAIGGVALILCTIILCLGALRSQANGKTDEEANRSLFTLHYSAKDSLYWLNDWRLPYPVYRFETGDIDGDGKPEALVGVIKKTRFYRESERRIFIFHLVEGKVRPLWLGSKLAGQLQDFRYTENGIVRSLEAWSDSLYSVAEWRWKDFGLGFERYLIHRTDKQTATQYFNL